jgi:hypothetical protein
MKKKKKQTLWVVTSSLPSSTGVPRTCFCDDLSSSDISINWARFYSWEEAKLWAEKNKIDINDLNQCIIQTDFDDFDMAMHSNKLEKKT